MDDETDTPGQVHVDIRQDAELFAHLKQLLKLYLRQRDKAMMLEIIEEVCIDGTKWHEIVR
jgi:Domain of unknown function in PX-proteins (DUF3818)